MRARCHRLMSLGGILMISAESFIEAALQAIQNVRATQWDVIAQVGETLANASMI